MNTNAYKLYSSYIPINNIHHINKILIIIFNIDNKKL